MPHPTLPVAGQRSELRYETPRGIGLVRATGEDAAWWLVAPLLAGNALLAFDAEPLAEAIAALREGGVPADVLAFAEGGAASMIEAAPRFEVAFAACDGGPSIARALHAALGPTAEGQRGLKALLSRLDGPQPGEAGFVRRFAWPKLVAVRTLRHGADLGFEDGRHRP